MNKKNDKSLWALFYENEAYSTSGNRIMGRQAAGNSLLKAYAKSNITDIGIFAKNPDNFKQLKNDFNKLTDKCKDKKLSYIPWGDPSKLSEFDGLYFPAPDISNFAKQRYFFGHDNYSLVGITHTTASKNAIDACLNNFIGPIMEWDALICTSNSVKESLKNLYDNYKLFLNDRFGVKKFPNMNLPVIPLGVHNDDFIFTSEYKNTVRRELAIDDNDICFLFLGRISFHAKSHHIPMLIILEKIAEKIDSNKKIHLIQTGWFPNDTYEKEFKSECFKMAPSIKFHFLDGKVLENRNKSYAASDLFISLVDNFQETFGLTPLEAMASGLPAIVSDWDGYKDTVRDNVDGIRIPTTTLQKGDGFAFSLRYDLGIDTYDHFIGRLSQTVSIDIRNALERIMQLIQNDELRKTYSSNAKKRAQEFDWKNILNKYQELKTDLREIRLARPSSKRIFIPPPNIYDPYSFFEKYPTYKLTLKSKVKIVKDLNTVKLDEFSSFFSVSFLENILPNVNVMNDILEFLKEKDYVNIEEISLFLKVDFFNIKRAIIWLSKFGYIEIKETNNG